MYAVDLYLSPNASASLNYRVSCNSAQPQLTQVSPTSGPGGAVTLTGTRFYGTRAVRFGALNAASFTIDSATQITAKTPPGTGTVVVSVTTDAGTTPETNVTYQYNVPTIALDPPSPLPNGALLAGYSQALTASGGTGPHRLAVTAGALPAGLALLPGGTLSGTPTVPGTFNFTVTATDDIGYTASQGYTITIDLVSQTLTFGVPPTVLYGGSGTVTASTTAAPSASYPITFSTASADCSVTSDGEVMGINAGTNNCQITATQAGDATYASATATQTLSIGKASQTLTFGTPPTVLFNGTGTVTASTSAVPTANYPITFSTPSPDCLVTSDGVVTGINAGTGNCQITGTQAGDANYADATATQTLSIGKASQAALIATANPVGIAPGATSTLGTTGGSGTGAVSFAVTAGNAFCTVNGTMLTGTAVGTCTVTATRAADANHDAATATVDVTVRTLVPVPTLSAWLLGLLGAMLAAMGLVRSRHARG